MGDCEYHCYTSMYLKYMEPRVNIYDNAYIYNIYIYVCNNVYKWLVVEPTPLKNMSSSVGIMNFPIYGKIKTCSKPPTSTMDIPSDSQTWFAGRYTI